jgi:hypothetical protein
MKSYNLNKSLTKHVNQHRLADGKLCAFLPRESKQFREKRFKGKSKLTLIELYLSGQGLLNKVIATMTEVKESKSILPQSHSE